MKYDVFISYRREGGYETAKHLNDLLVRDGYKVSFDIDTLRNGDFDVQLLERIEQCKDFILIIDPNAFDRTLDPTFDRNKDWLRIELAHALKHKKNIIPVFLAGITGFPEGLPDDVVGVVTKNGPEFNKYYFDDFYKKLKSRFLRSINRRRILFSVFLTMLLVIGLFIYILDKQNNPEYIQYQNPSDARTTNKEQFDNYVAKSVENFVFDSLCIPEDLDLLQRYWKVIADSGVAEAQFNVALLYYVSDNSNDQSKAIEYLQMAAKQNYPQALYSLGVCYDNAIFVKQNSEKATDLFYKAAIQDYAPAQNDYPISYYNTSAKQMEPSEIFEWFEKSAQQGYAPAQYHMSCCYSNSIGVTKDIDLYYYWLKKSADQNYTIARYNLAGFYLSAPDDYKDIDEGIYILESLVNEGFAYAYHSLAQCYANGIGVDKDINKAFELINKGVEKQDPIAIYALGCNYFKPYPGTGTQDYKKGLELLHQSANYGYPLAQYYIGVVYQNGLGVKKNMKKAQKWFDIAAMQNATHQTVHAYNNQNNN